MDTTQLSLINHARSLETDFVHNDANYQSKVELGTSSLVTGDYQNAKRLFDSAIEIDSKFPSAWLGKAFSEILNSSDDEFNLLNFKEYFNRAQAHSSNITTYKVVSTAMIASRHADIITKKIDKIEALKKEIEEEKKKKKKAQQTAALGAGVALASSGGKRSGLKTAAQVTGGAMAVGGTVAASQAEEKIKLLDSISDNAYEIAVLQAELSIPYLQLAEELALRLENQDLVSSLSNSISKWKKSIIYLYSKKENEFRNWFDKYQIKSENIAYLRDNHTLPAEVATHLNFMSKMGLSNQPLYTVINNFWNRLIKIYENPSDFHLLTTGEKKQEKVFVASAFIITISLYFTIDFLFEPQDPAASFWIFILCLVTGGILGVPLGLSSFNKIVKQTTAYSEAAELRNSLIEQLKSNQISESDIVISSIPH
jgi:tetratricopeptide (TPR) repeat protein